MRKLELKKNEDLIYRQKHIAIHLAICKALDVFGYNIPDYLKLKPKQDLKKLNNNLKSYIKNYDTPDLKKDKEFQKAINGIETELNEMFCDILDRVTN